MCSMEMKRGKGGGGGVDELNFQGGEGLRGGLEEVTAQASSWAAPLQERRAAGAGSLVRLVMWTEEGVL